MLGWGGAVIDVSVLIPDVWDVSAAECHACQAGNPGGSFASGPDGGSGSRRMGKL